MRGRDPRQVPGLSPPLSGGNGAVRELVDMFLASAAAAAGEPGLSTA